MNENDQEYEVSDKNWRVNYTVRKQINSKPQSEEELEEEVKEGDDFVPICEQSDIQFEILRVPDAENMFYVQFKRKRGAAMPFYESFKHYYDKLFLLHNATLEEGEAQ